MYKILIVDDSSMIRKIIKGILEKAGYKVIECGDGVSALEQVIAEKVDLIITDLNMPKMDGIQFVREIRKKALYRRLPILMLTTNPSEEEKALLAGANLYLKKPVSPERLVECIKKHLK